jgi:DNA-binding transcriptional LysR family regulator
MGDKDCLARNTVPEGAKNMDRWTELETFVAIAESESMTKAAETLRLSISGVSRYLMNLESRLGVRLVQRSTRRLSLTSEGEQFYADARHVLSSLQEAESNVSAGVLAPTGRLRIGASLSFCLLHLMPIVEQFRAAYPKVRVEIVASNRYYDIIENGLDLAIRTRRVEADSSIQIRRLAETRRLLAASPDYLHQRGVPQHPEELRAHDLILYTLADSWNELVFKKDDQAVRIDVDGIINANDGQLICAAARNGMGILVQPTYIIQADLESGRLVRILDDWDLPRLTMNIAFPTRSLLPARTRLFIDFLVERFREQKYEEIWTGHMGQNQAPARNPRTKRT